MKNTLAAWEKFVESFNGKYITVKIKGKKKRVRIIDAYNFEPPDRSVGIMTGSLTVHTKYSIFDCDTNGRVYACNDDGTIINIKKPSGEHNLRALFEE